MPNPVLLMIRPLAQGMDFVQELTAFSSKMPKTIYAPVIETLAVSSDPPPPAQFLLFSSVNGVKFFAAQTENRKLPALCVGDTTAAVAKSVGFSARSASGNAADLIRLTTSIADPAKDALLYVSGATVAHDLDGQLRDLGYSAARHVVYEQNAIPLTDAERAALSSPTVIPISSPNTARIFAEQTAQMDLSQITFVFISENARAPLAHTNSAQILAKTPTRDGMIKAISLLF